MVHVDADERRSTRHKARASVALQQAEGLRDLRRAGAVDGAAGCDQWTPEWAISGIEKKIII